MNDSLKITVNFLSPDLLLMAFANYSSIFTNTLPLMKPVAREWIRAIFWMI
jgi:hypothetical protein